MIPNWAAKAIAKAAWGLVLILLGVFGFMGVQVWGMNSAVARNTERIQGIEQRLGQIESKLTTIDAGVAGMSTNVQVIVDYIQKAPK